MTAVQLVVEKGREVGPLAGRVREICAAELAAIDRLCTALVEGRISIGCP
jgi:hypothetical protein